MKENFINMFDLFYCLTNIGDMINSEITNHHRQVAYLSYRIAESMCLEKNVQREVLLAGLLHDVGAFSMEEKLEIIDNEDMKGIHKHAFVGAALLENFEPISGIARMIRFHHVPWEEGEGRFFRGMEVPLESHILHLADRIAVQLKPDLDTIGQMKTVTDHVLEGRGKLFAPEIMDAFLNISMHEYIWLDLVYEPLLTLMPQMMNFDTLELDIDESIALTQMLSNVIDFKSPFTATHSSGVAAIAVRLAELAGFSENECKKMLIAGYLHDLGKLAVSNDILEKTGPLDKNEFNAIRSHTFYTYRTLQVIDKKGDMNAWAAYHHERLDGRGYPFHLKAEDIPLGSRIMAVADVSTAITEDRPYRKGMDNEKAKKVIRDMVKNGGLCGYVSGLLLGNFEELNAAREAAQSEAERKYNIIREIDKNS